mmetsp:Transcript_42017/g.125784  ORF Transcript_42017/g.125784 Transcript_42017/m.125784 type:complete len:152 (-) Transcript_42017:496-951(-)
MRAWTCTALLAVLLSASAAQASRDLAQTGAVDDFYWRRFPPYNCDNRLGISPYFLEPIWEQPLPNTTCFTVRTKTPTIEEPRCNNMDFYKLEMEVANTCINGIRRFYVNGEERVQPTGETFGIGGLRTLVKMPQVNIPPLPLNYAKEQGLE